MKLNCSVNKWTVEWSQSNGLDTDCETSLVLPKCYMLVLVGLVSVSCCLQHWWLVVVGMVAAPHLQSPEPEPGPESPPEPPEPVIILTMSSSLHHGTRPRLWLRWSSSVCLAWPWMSSGSSNLSAHCKGCNLWLKCHILKISEIQLIICDNYSSHNVTLMSFYHLYFILSSIVYHTLNFKALNPILDWGGVDYTSCLQNLL